MYQYDAIDQTIVDERVRQFRDQTQRFLAGELTEDQYRPLRLQNGLYIQRFAPMLRIAIPYGLLSSLQLRKLASIAREYDRGYGHFTTRQNLQFNWPRLETVPDILEELASVQMHAIQTSGNCIRNTTSDQYAGVAADELEDPRPYCEIIRQWSTLHPEFAYLPRKFKIAVTASATDRAAIRVHDIGLQIVENAQGERGFAVFVGGGLGRTPVIGTCIRDFLEPVHMLSYLEAILRVYNRLGRRDNKYKARIKILVRESGAERFAEWVEAEWDKLRDTDLRLEPEDIAHIQDFFQPPAYEPRRDSDAVAAQAASESGFGRWMAHNVIAHKQPGYRIVTVSLKAPDDAPGDCSAEQMERVADLADTHGFGEIRTTHEQNLILPDVPHEDLYTVWKALDEVGLATPNHGTLSDMIACPGLDFCSLANAGSIGVAREINALFDDLDEQYDLGEIKLKMSGCMNGCGHHSVGHIGILGVDKKGEEWYQITLGGTAAEDAELGQRLGASVSRQDIAPAIRKIVDRYAEVREGDELFLDTVRRLGITPFREAVYG
ncbi:MAG: sulfite reductase [Nevskiales bacterium]|nr:sulfite reductase [Nevskiales bacterium]